MKSLAGRLVLAFLALTLASPISGHEDRVPLTIQEAKTKHESRLLGMPGVVSVGIGLDAEGNAVIIIGLDGPRQQIEKKLPRTLEGYLVHTQIIGPVKAQ